MWFYASFQIQGRVRSSWNALFSFSPGFWWVSPAGKGALLALGSCTQTWPFSRMTTLPVLRTVQEMLQCPDFVPVPGDWKLLTIKWHHNYVTIGASIYLSERLVEFCQLPLLLLSSVRNCTSGVSPIPCFHVAHSLERLRKRRTNTVCWVGRLISV